MAKKNENHRKLLMVGPNAPFRFTEAYKSLRTNLEFLSATSKCKTILITSSVPEEGKSNVAVNLSATLASAGKKVILVDGDLRKGTLSRYLHINRNHMGTTNRIAGAADWQDVLVTVPDANNLILLPTGPLPPNPSEMLSGEKMVELFKELEEFADYVIVDTPPVSVVTDAAIMSRFADGVVLVVRSGVTTIQGSQLSKRNLEAVNARILGVVVNDYDAQKTGKKDGYYYSYNYYNYYDEEDGKGKGKAKSRKESK